MEFKDLENMKKALDRPAFRLLRGLKDLVGCEIGVEYGINARNIFENYDIKTLYLVDPYTLYMSVSGNVAGEKSEEVEKIAHDYLKPFSDRIVWIKEFSWNAVNLVPDNLDFVYIDGDHRKEAVERDIKLYYPKVKEGGLVAGHDYADRAPGVISAINEFFKGKEKLYSGGKWDFWVIKENRK